MKNRLLLSFAAVLIIGMLVPITAPGDQGAYNTLSGLAYCQTRTACLHEIGHALDRDAGWVSQSPEWYQAVQMYLLVELRKERLTELPVNILEITYRDRDGAEPVKMELYAYLFQQADGDPGHMPESLRGFYDWDLAESYMSRLNDHQMIYFLK